MVPLRALRRLGSALPSAHRLATLACSKYSRIENDSPSSPGLRFNAFNAAIQTTSVAVPSACFISKTRCFASDGSENASSEGLSKKETISVTFVDKDGDEKTIRVPVGISMLEAAHQNDIELEGACEGSLACSTCHVIVMDEKFYEKLPEPTDEENDMLDLAFGLTQTSRLGCQVLARPELDGMKLALPSATRNFAVDGFVPKPH